MQDLVYGLPRKPLPRRWVNKGKKKGGLPEVPARSATTGSSYHVRRDAYLVCVLRVRRRIPGTLANSGYAREISSAVYPFFGVALAEWVLMNG